MVCVVLVKEDLQTTLESRAGCLFPEERAARLLPLHLPRGRNLWALPLRKIPGGNLCLGARCGLEMGETGSSGTARSLSQEVG